EVVTESVRVGLSGRARVYIDRIELAVCKTEEIAPAGGRLILDRGTQVGIVIALGGIVGDSVEEDRAGRAEVRPGSPVGDAHAGPVAGHPAEVTGDRGVVEEIVGIASGRIETREQTEVVEPMERAGKRSRLEVRSEIPPVPRNLEFRSGRCAPFRGDVDYARK